jgi:hypothetical protein
MKHDIEPDTDQQAPWLDNWDAAVEQFLALAGIFLGDDPGWTERHDEILGKLIADTHNDEP